MKSGGNILVKGPMRGIYSRRFPGQLPGQIKKEHCTRPGKVGNALKERTGVLIPLYYTGTYGTCQERKGAEHEYKRHQPAGKGAQGADPDEGGA